MYVELKNINKSFGSFQAAEDVSFGIEKGKLIGLLGPSGSGKTTILRIIAGLETPDSGEILIDGKVINHIPASQRGIGFVFQNYALFRYMTVYENIAFGLKVRKTGKKETDSRVRELISLIGLEGLEKRYPSQLSGGQKQRVAFARALAPNPHLLLLDEPFAAIDAKVRKELRSWLKDMVETLNITSIFVTHDQEEAIEAADEIIISNRGRIEQKGTPAQVYQNPRTAFAASFLGQTVILKNYNVFHSFDEAGDGEYAVLRPEFVKVTKKNEVQKYISSASEGVIRRVSFRGHALELKVQVGDLSIIALRSLQEEAVEVGEKVDVFVYRLIVTDGKQTRLLENNSLKEDTVFI